MGYTSFAEVYDKLTKNVDYKSYAAFIRKCLCENSIQDGIILDCACGTGTLSKYLSDYGYDMILADSSELMLNSAREKNPDALTICQSMTELDLFGTVKSCVSTLDSINHLLTYDDVKKAFSKISLFTEKDGIFIFDVNTGYKHAYVLADNTFVYDVDGVYCVWQNRFLRKRMMTDITLDIFIKENDGKYRRETDSFSERAYDIDRLTELLEDTGFEVIGLFGDNMTDAPDDKSLRIYFEAKKVK